MYHGHPGRGGGPRDADDRRIGLFIDYDNLQQLLRETPELEPGELPRRLRELAQEHGRLVLACAYGDWSADPEQAREFGRQHIEPRMVVGADGDGTSQLVLSLDAQETLHLEPPIDAYVLVTDDRSCDEIVRRLRRADRAVILVSSEAAVVPQAFRGASRFLPVDDVLGGQARAPRQSRIDFSKFDWTPFVRLLDELEQNMPFVGFGWLLKKKLNAENSGCVTLQDKQELMDWAVEDGILTLYKVDNIEEGADPVTACKLNRESAVVRELVEP